MEEERVYLETEHGIISSNPITGQTAREVYEEGLHYYFKLVDGEYVRLTDEELKDKATAQPDKTKILENQLVDANNMIIDLQFQILTNNL